MFVFRAVAVVKCGCLGLVLSIALCGCTATGIRHVTSCTPCDLPDQIERGRPHQGLDAVGWVVGVPEKILLWNSRVNNHQISPQTEEQLRTYLASQGLVDVKVRLNQYAPREEWRRLRENNRIGAGWRYTIGTVSLLGYTLIPGRVFGGDWYNPYTNTVNVYSDVPAIGMEEASYAWDVGQRRYPGTYAFFQGFPILNMWHHSLATSKTLDYLEHSGTPGQVREAYHVLYPRYGMLAGNAVSGVVGAGTIPSAIELGGLVVGHAAGRYQGSRVEVAGESSRDSATAVQ